MRARTTGRYKHRLKPNHGREFPGQVVFVDTESWQERQDDGSVWHRLRLGAACYWRRPSTRQSDYTQWLVFRSAAEFWDWVESKIRPRTRLYLVSHNLDFDLPLVDAFRELPARGFELIKWYKEGTTTLLTFRRETVTIRCVDNMNIFASDLRSLGETLGVGKGSVDFAAVDDDTLVAYCKRDVEILLEAWRSWLRFLTEEDLGCFACTLASQAFNAWRHRFMDVDVFIHDNDDALRLEREAYTGGRVECFRVGRFSGERFYKLDVNAMYPSVMHDFEYPSALVSYKSDATLRDIYTLIDKYCLIARVLINTNENVFSTAVNGRRCYVRGRFWAVLTTRELQYALERDMIEDVRELAVYTKARLFTRWVEYVWAREQEAKTRGDRVRRYQWKILRNALYGKFGQRGLERECLGPATSADGSSDEVIGYVDGKFCREYNFAGMRWRDIQTEASFNAFVAIAAHVTADARMRLWSYMQRAHLDDVYYVDTDSLIVNSRGYERLRDCIDPGALGALKLEDESEVLEVWAPKDYAMGSHVKLKGISRSAQKLSDTLYEQFEWASIKQTLRTSTPDVVRTYPRLKKLERRIHSGVVREDARVEPWLVRESDQGLEVLNDPEALPLSAPAGA